VVLIQAGAVRPAELVCTGSQAALPAGAGHAVHICRRPAYILNDALEFRHTSQARSLPEDGRVAPALHDSALVVGQGTKGAGAKASPVAGDGKAHRLYCRNRQAVGWVGPAGVVQLVDPVQLLCGERLCRWVLHDHSLWVGLHHRPAAEGVLLAIVQGKSPGILPFV